MCCKYLEEDDVDLFLIYSICHKSKFLCVIDISFSISPNLTFVSSMLTVSGFRHACLLIKNEDKY